MSEREMETWAEEAVRLRRLAAAAPEMYEALKEINQHLRDVVDTAKNGDTNNWTGYYLPEFAKLSERFTALLAKAEGKC